MTTTTTKATTTTMSGGARPRFVVVEDGFEYTERFTRLLGDEMEFARATDLDGALALVGVDVGGRAAAGAPAGLLLDLDFRRAAAEALVDEHGRRGAARAAGERRALSEIQGILILRALRAAGVALPALLFADLADESQRRYIEETLGPVRVLGSSTGMAEIRAQLRACATPARAPVE